MMNIESIKSILSKGENEKIEFKESFCKKAIETIVAFSNTRGGLLLIGIKDDASVLGVELGEETLQNYVNQVKNSTEPSLIIDIEQIIVENRVVLLININEFPIKPVNFKGKYYKRVANSNHQMNLTEISNMHLQSLQLSWDAYEAVDVSYEHLDIQKIDAFLSKVNESGRFRLRGDRISNLQKLNLLKGNNPTNAAKLLFGKEQTLYNIHIGRFKTPSMILDDKMLRLPLYEAVEETMYYILSHIKVAFEFTGEIQRREIFEYPKEALRELVLNAIVHRDYTSPIDTQIKIFDKKITIFNPGRLYGEMTIEKLQTDNYQAQTRNKLIAEAFYLTNDTEKYGSGYIRVRREILEYPTMKLEYEEMGNGYLVTLSYEIQKTTQKSTHKTTQKSTQKTTKEKILELLSKDVKLTREALAKELNLSSDTIKKHLASLQKENRLKRVGGRKNGEWRVI